MEGVQDDVEIARINISVAIEIRGPAARETLPLATNASRDGDDVADVDHAIAVDVGTRRPRRRGIRLHRQPQAAEDGGDTDAQSGFRHDANHHDCATARVLTDYTLGRASERSPTRWIAVA